MSASRAVRVVPPVVFLGAFGLLAAGMLTPDWPVFVTVAGVFLVAGTLRRRLDGSAREERERRLADLAVAHGLQPVEPPRRRGVVASLQGAAQGDATVDLVDSERDSPSWELWHAVLPSGSIDCRFLAVGEREGRPLRLSLERTTESGDSRNHRTKTRRSVAVATRVDVDGTVEVRPAGRAWQAIGDAVGRVFRQEAHEVGVPEFDDAYSVTGDAEAAQALLDLSTAAGWPDRIGDATVAVADGWLAAARTVPLEAEETAATAERLLPAVDELARRLSRR